MLYWADAEQRDERCKALVLCWYKEVEQMEQSRALAIPMCFIAEQHQSDAGITTTLFSFMEHFLENMFIVGSISDWFVLSWNP